MPVQFSPGEDTGQGGGDHLPAESPEDFPGIGIRNSNGLSGRVSTSAGFRADLYLESPGEVSGLAAAGGGRLNF